jgi:serine/threonine-protein kinase
MKASTPAPLGVVAHYMLLEQLEPAGPGDLYRARDTRLGRTVTVRVLASGGGSGRGSLIERARHLGAISHPNLTAVFDTGEQDDRAYLVFEFQKGQTLRADAAGRQMNVRRAVEIGIQLAEAVAEAHARGIVLDGLSPDSVVVSERGRAKIPLFALATRFGFESGERLIDYESPEEARGERGDQRSDVYSIGAILYEALTTRRPLHRGASAPSASNPKVPGSLDAVVLKALAPSAANRFESAAALADALRQSLSLLRDGGASQGGSSLAEQPSRTPVVVVAIVLVAAALAWWLVSEP